MVEGNGHQDAAAAGGMLREVDYRDIEDAISQMHMERNDTGMRAYILNLLVCANGPAYAETARDVGAQVCVCYPSRAVVMEADPLGDAALTASVGTRADFADTSISVASEEIVLHAGGESVRQLPGMVTPLLIPDIPVSLYWLGDVPFGHPLFDGLMNASDQLIVDSAQFTHPVSAVERLHGLADDQYSGVTFNDLAWVRLMTWREATAQFFDAPAFRPALDGLQRVSVTFAVARKGATNPMEALLYGGWLAARLGWQAVPDLRRVGRQSLFVLRHHDAPVIVEATGRTTDAVPNGDLLSVQLEGETEEGAVSFHLERGAAPGQFRAVTIQNGQQTDERTLPMETRGAGDMVCDVVGSVRRDTIYDEALDLVVRLVGSDTGER